MKLPELKPGKRFGQNVFLSQTLKVKTDRNEKGKGYYVSDEKNGHRGEWIAYTLKGELLEGDVVEWK